MAEEELKEEIEKIKLDVNLLKLFIEIDEAIEKCKKEKPVQYEKSQFKKEYEKIRMKWMGIW